jgi:hypothetical protein
MQYDIAGLTFEFEQDEDGLVTTIVTPDITVGPVALFPATRIDFSPGRTVQQAQQIVQDLLAALGIS